MVETLPVSTAKTHLNQLVRQLDRTDSAVVIRNMRTNDCVVLLAAHKWQRELEQLLDCELQL
ncbi:type II toxin-antitoxin system Phd/YefM family antitoxin [Loigolactobacillus binensis]|uniref:Type II toxin-antitoxin system Phd/YefM family antitoxin n=1 Tax=Loigolactobacillus binensis TaxID=2559922 RepID=A0ABW3EBI1_9LACO|nr:type II toxin-antitoxin system Phd/YefM family antitoxin [Loigolactobacillus binensis]